MNIKIYVSKSRSFTKAFTWRFFATIDTFIITYFIILQSNFSAFKTASLIAGLEIITKILIYYLHERIWEKIKWGNIIS